MARVTARVHASEVARFLYGVAPLLSFAAADWESPAIPPPGYRQKAEATIRQDWRESRVKEPEGGIRQ